MILIGAGLYDDATRMFTPVVDGALGVPRPYDALENANADSRAAYAAEQDTERAIRRAAGEQITALRDAEAALDLLIAKANTTLTAGDTKTGWRACREAVQASLRLARVVSGRLTDL